MIKMLGHSFSRLAATIIEEVPIEALYLTGGDTAWEVLKRIGVQRLEAVDELAPLVAVTRVADGPQKGILVVTKGGLVGSESTAYRSIRSLARYLHS